MEHGTSRFAYFRPSDFEASHSFTLSFTGWVFALVVVVWFSTALLCEAMARIQNTDSAAARIVVASVAAIVVGVTGSWHCGRATAKERAEKDAAESNATAFKWLSMPGQSTVKTDGEWIVLCVRPSGPEYVLGRPTEPAEWEEVYLPREELPDFEEYVRRNFPRYAGAEVAESAAPAIAHA